MKNENKVKAESNDEIVIELTKKRQLDSAETTLQDCCSPEKTVAVSAETAVCNVN